MYKPRVSKYLSRTLPAVLLTALASTALAQTSTQPRLFQDPDRPPNVTTVTISPSVAKITPISSSACRTNATIVYEKGVSPEPPAGPNAEMLGGLSGLRLVGRLIDRIDRIELVVGSGAVQQTRIFDPIAADTTCTNQYGAGKGGISVELALPEVTASTTGRLRIFGREQNVLTVQGQPPREGAVKLVEEVELTILPRPEITSSNPTRFTQDAAQVGGRVTFTGRNLNAPTTVLPDGDASLRVTTTGRTPTQWTADTFRSMPAPDTRTEVYRPQVMLMRNGTRQPKNFSDTRLDGQAQLFPSVSIVYTRPAPAAPQPPRLEGHDPGNVLYIVGSGTTTDRDGNIYSALNSMDHCQGIPLPPNPDAQGQFANRRDITVPDIRWGVTNRGTTEATGTFTVELHKDTITGPVLATFNVVNLAAGATRLAPNFRRPDSTNTVALISGGGVCYHAGLRNEGWNDNGGYFVTVRNIANSARAIDPE